VNSSLIKNSKASRVLAVLLVGAFSIQAVAQSIAVPNSYLEAEGNSSSSYPFHSGFTVRYQQVYEASQFSAATNGGWVYWLNFRPDSSAPGFGATVTDVEIHLSTTPLPSNGLNSLFGQNLGPDDAQVFYGALYLYNGGPGWGFGYNQAQLTNYFWYDPKLGNLLLDMRIHTLVSDTGGLLPGPIPPMDAATNQGVSSVFAPSVDATSGTTVNRGLVTLITVAPVPSLVCFVSSFGTSTNYITIRWPTQPGTFVLQQATVLGANALWQSLPGVGGSNLVFKEYRIPITSAGKGAFFRLARPSG
jgi:hypothetical protein